MRNTLCKGLAILMLGIFSLKQEAYSVIAGIEPTSQETEILNLTNQVRVEAGLKPLKINSLLMKEARDQSDSMAHESTLCHTIGEGNFETRMTRSGYSYRNVGENIAQSRSSAYDVIQMWMNSEGHRSNIMDAHFEDIGIGISVSADGDAYYTQVFGAQ
jgi:uncharacterized protein YkwD